MTWNKLKSYPLTFPMSASFFHYHEPGQASFCHFSSYNSVEWLTIIFQLYSDFLFSFITFHSHNLVENGIRASIVREIRNMWFIEPFYIMDTRSLRFHPITHTVFCSFAGHAVLNGNNASRVCFLRIERDRKTISSMYYSSQPPCVIVDEWKCRVKMDDIWRWYTTHSST